MGKENSEREASGQLGLDGMSAGCSAYYEWAQRAAEFPEHSSYISQVGCCVLLQFCPYSELTRGHKVEKGTLESGILKT